MPASSAHCEQTAGTTEPLHSPEESLANVPSQTESKSKQRISAMETKVGGGGFQALHDQLQCT